MFVCWVPCIREGRPGSLGSLDTGTCVGNRGLDPSPQGWEGDLVPTMPGCVCPKVKDMDLFSTSSR